MTDTSLNLGETTIPKLSSYAEWTLDNDTIDGNPYDLDAIATFNNAAGGDTVETGLFYNGNGTYSFRFTGLEAGDWTFATSSEDPDLDGYTGTVSVVDNPDARGFVTASDNKFAQITGSGEQEALLPNYIMIDQNIENYHNNPSAIQSVLETFIDGHGFTGVHIPAVAGQLFDLNSSTANNGSRIDGSQGYDPDPEAFEALEQIITATHEAGGVTHIWLWGDSSRGQTPDQLPGGENGEEHQRIMDYVAARLGPLPGWTLGYGFDNDEWTTPQEAAQAHQYFAEQSGYDHLYGVRSPGPNTGTDHGRDIVWHQNQTLSDFEHWEPTYEVYVAALEASPGENPVLSGDRFRVINDGEGKDYTEEQTVDGLWISTMAGGVANIWGNLNNPSTGRFDASHYYSFPYSNDTVEQISTWNTFFLDENRFVLDSERANELTGGPENKQYALQSESENHIVIYAEDTSEITLNLASLSAEAGWGGGANVIAVDTEKGYQEIDLGSVTLSDQTLALDYESDWALFLTPSDAVPADPPEDDEDPDEVPEDPVLPGDPDVPPAEPPTDDEDPEDPVMPDDPGTPPADDIDDGDANVVYELPETIVIRTAADVVSVTHSPALELTEATVSLTFNARSVAGSQGIVTKDANQFVGGDHFALYLEGDTLNARFQDSGRQESTTLRFEDVKPGEDYEVDAIFGQNGVQLYVNDQLVDQDSSHRMDWLDNEQYLQIGASNARSPSGSQEFAQVFDGSIDNLRIYDGAVVPGGQQDDREDPDEIPQDPVMPDDPGAPPMDDIDDDAAEAVYELPETVVINDASDVISVAHSPALELSEATISLTFNADSVTGSQGIVTKDANRFVGGDHFALYLEGDTLNARFQDSGQQETTTLRFRGVRPGEDYDVDAIFGENGVKLYVNDQLVAQDSSHRMDWLDNEQYLQIGASNTRSPSGSQEFSQVFGGTISNLRIYDKALVPGQELESDEVSNDEATISRNDVLFDDEDPLLDDFFFISSPPPSDPAGSPAAAASPATNIGIEDVLDTVNPVTASINDFTTTSTLGPAANTDIPATRSPVAQLQTSGPLATGFEAGFEQDLAQATGTTGL